MRRFTLQPDRLVDGRVTFDADESRHLSRVLRLQPGDTVIATDGGGRDYTVRLESVGEAATGTVIAEAAGVPESPLAITLVQGVPKGDKMEAIVRAATELGVARVRPALCERTIVRLEPGRWRDRAALGADRDRTRGRPGAGRGGCRARAWSHDRRARPAHPANRDRRPRR